jgi:small subunit ribosomal protein S4
MARYTGPREKIERRIGEKLFLKGERSHGQKAAMVRKPYPPGQHGQGRPRKLSEFGQQLKAKQKVRNIYRLLEKPFKAYVKAVLEKKQEPYEPIMLSLETRLDNMVYRSGFAQSRDQARQIVNHGHILVNGKKVSIPSYRTKQGEVISIREGSKKSPYFSTLMPAWFMKYEAPSWILLDKEKGTATIKGKPTVIESGIRTEDIQSIVEYYSR